METLQPKLRFPEFKNDVISYRNHLFNDLFVFSTGKNIKQNEASPDFQVPCVRYGELYHMYNEVIRHVINKTNLDISELHFSKGNEILLPSAGEDPLDIGSASALTIENVAIGRTINVLRPLKENIYSQIFVSYYINHKLKVKISTLAKGSSISNVYNSDLKTLEIKLPSLPEQTRIADFLSAVDEKLHLLKEKKALLEEYKKGMMQKIFNQELRFKDDNGEDFGDWEEKKFSNFIKLYRGSSPRPIVQYTTTSDDGVNWIKIGDTKKANNFIIDDVSEKITVEGAKHSRKVEIGEIILANSMSFGKSYILNIEGCIYDGWFVLREYDRFFEKMFLIQLLNSDYLQSQYNTLSTGGVVQNISSEIVYSTFLLKPPLKEQTKIAQFLSAIDDKIGLVGNQIEETVAYKKGLLQGMFV